MGDNVVPFNHPMTPELALKRIRQAASRETDKIGFTDHALMDRMGDDIWSGRWSRSQEGALIRGPTWDDDHEDWTCVFVKNVSGRRIHVVAALNDRQPDEVTIVTAY